MIVPLSPEQFAEALKEHSKGDATIEIRGSGTKRRAGGFAQRTTSLVSTQALTRVAEYEPKDLTISVEAGMKWADLERTLAANKQMVPLDPPYRDGATVGGVIAANSCGPRRRGYGSARDMVIGMQFATVEGKLIRCGGMVVKNVAGLDMGKLMIGSYGTLGAIVSVNFKLFPVPPVTRSFVFTFAGLDDAVKLRDQIVAGVLQPSAVDLVNPHASALLGGEGWMVAIGAGGSERVMDRYRRELAGAEVLEGEREAAFWGRIREFCPAFLARHEEGAIVRVSAALKELRGVATAIQVPMIARAASGVAYGAFPDSETAARWVGRAAGYGWAAVLESIPSRVCSGEEQWPHPGPELEIMKKVKKMLDPGHALNPGRLYGRI